jgi:transglutaminase-like putative cysteine protease
MRISVLHSTVFRYDNPVVLEPHVFRLRPREDGTQRLIRHDLEILPAPQGRSVCIDPNGNSMVQAWFNQPVPELSVCSSFEIETLRQNPFDFLLPALAALQLPLHYSASDAAAVAPYLAETSDVSGYAQSLASQAGGQTMAFLQALLRDLFEGSEHVYRAQGEAYPPDQTLRDRRGSCRDYSVLFCAACRAMGVAARFVSGYETQSAFQDQAHMHAWAEVYIPGGGWRGYDPSRGVAVSTSHVAVAAAAQPSEAAPITGTFRGAARSRIESAISMQTA